MTSQDHSQSETDMTSIKMLADAVTRAIGDNDGNKRFIDIGRIPLICLSITGIHESLQELKEMMKSNEERYASKLTEKIVYGMVGILMTGVVIALLALIIKK